MAIQAEDSEKTAGKTATKIAGSASVSRFGRTGKSGRAARSICMAVLTLPIFTEGIMCAEKTAETNIIQPSLTAHVTAVQTAASTPVEKANFLLDNIFGKGATIIASEVEGFYNFSNQNYSNNYSGIGSVTNNDGTYKEDGLKFRVKSEIGKSGWALTFDMNESENSSELTGRTVYEGAGLYGLIDNTQNSKSETTTEHTQFSLSLSAPFSWNGVHIMEIGGGMDYYSRKTDDYSNIDDLSIGGYALFSDGSSYRHAMEAYSAYSNQAMDDNLSGLHISLGWKKVIPLNMRYTYFTGKRCSYYRGSSDYYYVATKYNSQGQNQGGLGLHLTDSSDITESRRDIKIHTWSLNSPLQFGKKGRTLVLPGYTDYTEDISMGDSGIAESVTKRILTIAIKQRIWTNFTIGAGCSHTMRTDKRKTQYNTSAYHSSQKAFTVYTGLQF